MKKISVIIPVYNCEKYIELGMNNILKQDIFDELEVIIIDDGSTDSSLNLLKKYDDKYENIKVYHQNNFGVSVARNKGIEKSSCDFITFYDIDDCLESNIYSHLYEKINKSGNDLSIINFDLICNKRRIKIGKEKINKVFNKEEALINFLKGKYISNSVCDKIFRKSIIINNNILFPEGNKIGEDMYFNFLYLNCCTKIDLDTFNILYHYIVNNNSAMNKKFDSRFYDTVELSKKMFEFYSKKSVLYKYTEAHYIHEVCKVIEYMIRTNASKETDAHKKKYKKILKEYKILNAYRYLSKRKFFGYLLMRFSEKLYMFFWKVLKVG